MDECMYIMAYYDIDILYIILYTLYNVLYTLNVIQCSLYIIQYCLYVIHYTIFFIRYTIFFILYTSYVIQYSLHFTLYTLHFIQYTIPHRHSKDWLNLKRLCHTWKGRNSQIGFRKSSNLAASLHDFLQQTEGTVVEGLVEGQVGLFFERLERECGEIREFLRSQYLLD